MAWIRANNNVGIKPSGVVMDWLAGVIELLAGWIIGNKRKVGFILLAICDIIWAYVAISREVYGLLLVVIPAFFINIRNYRKWKRGIDEALFKKIARQVESEWKMGGLSDGLYYDYALEISKRLKLNKGE